MVTNYPEYFSAAAARRANAGTARVERALTRLGQLMCGLRGHEPVVHFEGKRLMMRCTSCGHDTPGWELAEHAPRRRYEGDARRHVLASPRLVLRKSA